MNLLLLRFYNSSPVIYHDSKWQPFWSNPLRLYHVTRLHRRPTGNKCLSLYKFLWNQSLGAEPAKAPALILTPLMTKYGANYDWLLLMTTQVTSGAPIDPEARHPSMRIMAVTEEIRTPFTRAILWNISYLLPYDFWPVLYSTFIAWSIV